MMGKTIIALILYLMNGIQCKGALLLLFMFKVLVDGHLVCNILHNLIKHT